MASAHQYTPLTADFFGDNKPAVPTMTATAISNAELLAEGASTLARSPLDQIRDLLSAAALVACAAGIDRTDYQQAASLAWPAASSTHHPAPAEVKPSTAAAPATLSGVDAGAGPGEQGCPFDEAL
jgi:2-methylcitrate dehydratase PrpD